jgi:choline dehydrogenase
MMPATAQGADYVIVGAGSAGCVLAYRLVQAGASVLLLEAGPDLHHPWIRIPAGVMKLLRHPTLDWNYQTEPDPGIAGRSLHWPRGRVVGGSGSINGMLYVRGMPADYDAWAALGCTGWSWDELLPLFKRSERYPQGDAEVRGHAGLLAVRDYDSHFPVTRAFVDAAQQAGFTFTPDMNGRLREAAGYSQMTRNGRFRGSTASTFLRAVRRSPLLRLQIRAQATRVLLHSGRAVGVEYRHHGELLTAHAGAEVILCGGTINTPQLLQLSGIGDPQHLRTIGVEPQHELPGVGRNLIDHLRASVAFRSRGASLNPRTRGLPLALEVLKYVAVGRGALTMGVTAASVFCRVGGAQRPNLQLMFSPSSFDQDRFGQLERQPGATLTACLGLPESRGTVLARSADPAQPPAIRPGYLSAPADLANLVEGVRLARRVAAQPALARLLVEETLPGPRVASDRDIADYVRRASGSVFHPVGTCRMGVDAGAVLDPRLKVRGIAGLRIADGSVMPTLVNGNTNAACVMIGEKAADLVLQDARSPAAQATPEIAKEANLP